MKINILRYDSIDSTNIEALKHARKDADEGLCIVARQQTEGRGRQGRSWISPPDAGLYLSIILRPQLDAKSLPLITLAAAVAVFDTLTELELLPDIKWPNDILVDEKKICGILAETVDSNNSLAVILGIGINTGSNSFSPELADRTTSLEDATGKSVPIRKLEESLLDKFGRLYERLCESGGPAEIIRAWSQRSSYATGKDVRATVANISISGVTDGLEPDGALRIVTCDGILHIIHAGDVERLRRAE